jgi:hypothetical protein
MRGARDDAADPDLSQTEASAPAPDSDEALMLLREIRDNLQRMRGGGGPQA